MYEGAWKIIIPKKGEDIKNLPTVIFFHEPYIIMRYLNALRFFAWGHSLGGRTYLMANVNVSKIQMMLILNSIKTRRREDGQKRRAVIARNEDSAGLFFYEEKWCAVDVIRVTLNDSRLGIH